MKHGFREAIIRVNHAHEKVIAPIIADGAIATAHVGDGRMFPLVILDTTERPDIDEAIKAHAYSSSGDVKVQWGRMIGRDHTVSLNLTFVRPAEVFVIVEFDLTKRHAILVEQVLENRGLYLQAGKPGDRLKHNINKHKVLAEVPDTGFRPAWAKIFLDYKASQFRADGMSRLAAKRAARFAFDEIRKIAAARPKFVSDDDA